MPIDYTKTKACLIDAVSVEDAETLLQWLQDKPKGKLDLARATHLHAAVLQVLLATMPAIAAMPADEELTSWLIAAAINRE